MSDNKVIDICESEKVKNNWKQSLLLKLNKRMDYEVKIEDRTIRHWKNVT